jgi:hypothetical protein
MREHLDDAPYGTFAEGHADPGRYSDDDRAGSFGDGQAGLPAELEPGRFSVGMEELGEDDPEKGDGQFRRRGAPVLMLNRQRISAVEHELHLIDREIVNRQHTTGVPR